MRRRTGSALVKVVACRLFDTKPLPEPMLAYYQLDSYEQFFMNNFSNHNTKFLIHESAFKNTVCQIGGHFVMG